MQTQSLEKGVAITSQLTVEELEQVKAQGFKTVICNCKPGESAEFSGEDAYRFKAAELGLHWVHIPVTPGEYSQADVAAFAQALQQLPRPILAFCRSGKRATHLWAYAKRHTEKCDLAELFSAAKAAGFDLEAHRQGLENQTA
ncbi:TIGR01244 family sulfur transferase [Vreelandella venusta]|uniref:TIGR01244 family phosphatase n=1 Tax=Vreelandella venusta TaxID=44935 RepID=A0AAP9ZDX4_9GAMM|nr:MULTISPECIES: TIGR01244 family sulfur transferase [Halomonas]MDX1356748.1 TIGR01244 family sulfur transferase [Halomonas venusta]QPI64717.1 TIGR01244 family phosphatase [Halomonas venusta]QRL03916.1 TIGR01244 family phosphatase [Halomonas venusta]UQI41260.1 TIGR01244 family sulfur transferase [Halomonas venusta]WAM49137.1 TIGR01244 family sulfur transferase [Halomonas venusta]